MEPPRPPEAGPDMISILPVFPLRVVPVESRIEPLAEATAGALAERIETDPEEEDELPEDTNTEPPRDEDAVDRPAERAR